MPCLQELRISGNIKWLDEARASDVVKLGIVPAWLPDLRIVELDIFDVRHMCAILHSIPSPRDRITASLHSNYSSSLDESSIAQVHTAIRDRLSFFWAARSENSDAQLSEGVLKLEKTQVGYRQAAGAGLDTMLEVVSPEPRSLTNGHPISSSPFSFSFRVTWSNYYAPSHLEVYMGYVRNLHISLAAAHLCFSGLAPSWAEDLLYTSFHRVNLDCLVVGQGQMNVHAHKALLMWIVKCSQAKMARHSDSTRRVITSLPLA